MISKITGGETRELLTAKVLGRYDVKYYQCLETGFIQTEEPYWLDEAYSTAITKLDIGLPYRNELLRDKVVAILSQYFDTNSKFLDYGGGYGLFTRLMRDKGFDFYHTDMYCKNLFAEYFDLTDSPPNTYFELTTAFEVFEHLTNPLLEIETISKYSDSILFSTELVSNQTLNTVDDWWYFIPETGQHIALYTLQSLQYIANKWDYNFYTDGSELHLFTKKKLPQNPFNEKLPFLIRKMTKLLKKYHAKKQNNIESLLQKDWEYIKKKLSK